MSNRKNILALLLAAEKGQTYDELLAATGTTRHGLSNALSALRLAGIVDTVPATFFVSDEVRADLKRQAMRNAADKARKAAEFRQKEAKRAKARRQAAKQARRTLEVAVPTAPMIFAPVGVPSSVFDIARVMGVAA